MMNSDSLKPENFGDLINLFYFFPGFC